LRSETVFDCSPDAVEIGLALVQTELIKVAMPQQINVAPSKKILSYLSHLNWQVLLPKGFTDREGV
jgi:ABC-type uncharacterized transport system auxiliary subunit